MEEKRKFIRMDIEGEVKYRIKGSTQPQTLCQSKDIGTEGIRILTDEELEVGTILELEIFAFDKFRSFFATGEVVWQKEIGAEKKGGKRNFEVRIKFIEIDNFSQNRIGNYVYRTRREKRVKNIFF